MTQTQIIKLAREVGGEYRERAREYENQGLYNLADHAAGIASGLYLLIRRIRIAESQAQSGVIVSRSVSLSHDRSH